MATASATAQAVLSRMANREVNDEARKLVEQGEGEWSWDPYVPNVIGLLRPGTNKAWIVVYVEDSDFECSDEMEARL